MSASFAPACNLRAVLSELCEIDLSDKADIRISWSASLRVSKKALTAQGYFLALETVCIRFSSISYLSVLLLR